LLSGYARLGDAAFTMTETASQPAPWFEALGRAADVLRAAGPEYEAAAGEILALKERLAGGRFHLAVLGQFKRGKSTVLNALLGEAILPTSVVPLTAVPTWIEAGPSAGARIKLRDGSVREFATQRPEELSSLLTRYVTESGNPGNALGVTEATVRHPAAILAQGVVLVDTPGIGSTLRQNTEATLRFLPQSDAAVFLVSADPPITETEVEFLQQVQAQVPRLFFVLNKIDYLDEAQRQEALNFLRRVLAERAGVDEAAPIFAVSARSALDARRADDTEAWRASGMDAVERHLLDFLAREKSDTLQEAVRRKTHNILAESLLRLRLSLRSLQIPLENLRSRLVAFDQWLVEMRREQVAAHDRLAGDRRRARELIEAQYEQLRSRASRSLHTALTLEMSRPRAEPLDESTLHSVLESTIPPLFKREFQATAALVEQRMREVLRVHEDRADALIESVQKTAADLFEVSFVPPQHLNTFEPGRTPYWLMYRWDQGFGLITLSLIDKLLPRSARERRLARRYHAKVDMLALTNAGKLREALSDQIDAAFKRFARQFDERIAAAIAATHGAIRAALVRREELSARSADDARRQEQMIEELSQCLARIS
jgi:GTP-binding protein EngB required for normal cell division